MYFEPEESKQLDAGWRIILIVWAAIIASLAAYLGICLYFEPSVQASLDPSFPLDLFKYALYAVACAEFVAIYFLRRFFLTRGGVGGSRRPAKEAPQHPAVGRYLQMTIVIAALSESIGIYGVVVFFLAKDTLTLCQFIAFAALALIAFRPRKEELLQWAAQMKQAGGK